VRKKRGAELAFPYLIAFWLSLPPLHGAGARSFSLPSSLLQSSTLFSTCRQTREEERPSVFLPRAFLFLTLLASQSLLHPSGSGRCEQCKRHSFCELHSTSPAKVEEEEGDGIPLTLIRLSL